MRSGVGGVLKEVTWEQGASHQSGPPTRGPSAHPPPASDDKDTRPAGAQRVLASSAAPGGTGLPSCGPQTPVGGSSEPKASLAADAAQAPATAPNLPNLPQREPASAHLTKKKLRRDSDPDVPEVTQQDGGHTGLQPRSSAPKAMLFTLISSFGYYVPSPLSPSILS